MIKNRIEKGADSWGKKIHGARIPYDAREFSKNGIVGDPTNASSEKGKEIFQNSTEELTDLIKEFKKSERSFFDLD